jgi:hypothetical protein
MLLYKGALDGVIAAQSLYGGDFASLCKGSQENTARDRLAIHKRCAGSAYSDATGCSNTSQIQISA